MHAKFLYMQHWCNYVPFENTNKTRCILHSFIRSAVAGFITVTLLYVAVCSCVCLSVGHWFVRQMLVLSLMDIMMLWCHYVMTSLHFDMSCYDIITLLYDIITYWCHYHTLWHHNVEISLPYILMFLCYDVITLWCYVTWWHHYIILWCHYIIMLCYDILISLEVNALKTQWQAS